MDSKVISIKLKFLQFSNFAAAAHTKMARKKDFDEMTLITEESTINEPYNQAKKEAQLRELHRQINGTQSQQDNEF